MSSEVSDVCQYTPVGEPTNFYYHRRNLCQKLMVWAGFCGNAEFFIFRSSVAI